MAKNTNAQKYSVSLRPNVMEAVESKMENFDGGERSATISRLLERYLDLLKREQIAMRELFSDGEKGLIIDSLNGIGFFDSFSLYHVGAEVADAISMDGLDNKWGVDGAALKTKLANLNNGQCHALVDAVQQWWNKVARGEETKPAHLFDRGVKND